MMTQLAIILSAILLIGLYTVWSVLYCAMSARSVILWRLSQPGMGIAIIVFAAAAILSGRTTVSEVAKFFRDVIENE